MDIVLLEKFILLIVNILGIFLGVSVLLANRKSKTNIFFSISTLMILLWADCSFLINFVNSQEWLVFFGRANLAFFSLFCISIYLLISNYPREKKSLSWRDVSVIITGTIIFFLTYFTSFVTKNIQIIGNSRVWDMGEGEWVLFLYAGLVAVIIIVDLIIKFKISDKADRTKIMYFIISAVLFAIFNIVFNVLFPLFKNTDAYYPFGDYSVIFFLVLTAYAILKHQMFNIKVIATEAAVIIISIALLVEAFISNSATEGVLVGAIWIIATYGGILLIRSIKHEIAQREELQKLTTQLEDANEHLKEMDKLKDDFLSMASHELNTPITAIQGYLSMILEEHLAGEVNPTVKQYLGRVYESAKRLAALVKDLLNVSRIESGRIHIIYEEAQIEDLIEQAQAEVMPYVKNAGHKMSFDKPKHKMPKTWFDKTRITEVLINIMGNAVKYTEPPGLIEVSVSADKAFITVQIKDNGRGIPKDKQDTVFAKFSQIDVLKDQIKGTGLGMYISKKFVELMNGKIWFESHDGKGTTFVFTVPIVDKKPTDTHEGEGAILH